MTDDRPSNRAMSFEDHMAGSNPDSVTPGMLPDPKLFTAEFWANRDLPNPDFLLGDLMTTTSRMLLIGPTGIGKSNVGLAIAFAAAAGAAFLHWAGRRASKVIYIDGEMSARLTKDRVQQAIKRHGGLAENLIIINREDFEDMPALNTEAGQKFIEHLVEQLGSVDLIVFDNIQALVVGSHKEDLTWEPVLPWIRKLTSMKIGQLWMHHTGHATDRGYGDKTREWQFDTVALMKAPETPRPERLLEFRLEFTKARERGPSNRADFETVDIWLDAADAWQSTASPAAHKRTPSPTAITFYRNLSDLLAQTGKRDLPFKGAPPATTRPTWLDYLTRRGIIDGKAKDNVQRAKLYKYQAQLIDAGWIAADREFIWATRTPIEPQADGCSTS